MRPRSGDPGGETNFGISARANPDIDIKDLTLDEAVDLYLSRYWEPAGCPEVAEISGPLAAALFDDAVHAGPPSAVKRLQAAVEMDPRQHDGIVGPKTLAAVRGFVDVPLVDRMVELRREFLMDLVERSEKHRRYGQGFNLRVNRVKEFARALSGRRRD